MTYIVVQFEYNNRHGMYEKLLRVFEQSVKENDPKNDVVVKRISPPKVKSKQCFSSNTLKLGVWVEEMEKLPEGHEICFIDCDMMVLKPSDDVFKNDFDICYTKRPRPQNSRLPVNGGVIFCKNNECSRHFMRHFRIINDKMYNDRKFHERWRKKYAGMNQAAFGYLLEHPKEYTAKLFGVECNTYNVCNESWHNVGKNQNIRIVHIKSALRKMCVTGSCTMPNCKKAVEIWNQLYKNAGGKDIEVRMTSAKVSPFSKKKSVVIPGTKRNVHRLDMGKETDENIRCLIGRKTKRRVYIP